MYGPNEGRAHDLYCGGTGRLAVGAQVRPPSRLTKTRHDELWNSASTTARILGSFGSTMSWGSLWARPGVMSWLIWTDGVTGGPPALVSTWAETTGATRVTASPAARAANTRLSLSCRTAATAVPL